MNLTTKTAKEFQQKLIELLFKYNISVEEFLEIVDNRDFWINDEKWIKQHRYKMAKLKIIKKLFIK